MGLFDTIYNSFKPLGDEFLNRSFQTKNLGRGLQYYWISPNGELYSYDTSECYEFDWDNIDIRGYVSRTKSTGKHGKISPSYVNKTIVMYDLRDKNNLVWLESTLKFKLGKVIDYQINYGPRSPSTYT